MKSLETYGYQVAYYLLQDEELALEAATLALLELGKDDECYILSPTEQRSRMKRIAIQKALTVKKNRLTQMSL